MIKGLNMATKEKTLKDELLEKHPDYLANITDWNFYDSAYNGGQSFIDLVLTKNERESDGNYNKRKKNSYYINFSREIIDIFNFYLTEKPVIRQFGPLGKNTQWMMFEDDCDLEGTNFDVFMNELSVMASTVGSVGVLVDKPRGDGEPIISKQDEINKDIYPYCAVYTRPNVFDWEWIRDPATGKRIYTYLKLCEENNDITKWYQDRWERWRFPLDSQGKELDPIIVDSGINPLGIIPFVWLENIKRTSKKDLGLSDIIEISKVSGSIVRDFSHADEVIEYAAFPMLLEPWEHDGSENPGSGGETSEVGVRAVKGFDAENPQSKPSWLEAEVLDPIDAVLKMIDKKVDYIFQMAHLSGVHSVEKSREARSGVALRMEFNQLWSVLSKKSNNMNEAELKIIWFWLIWQNETALYNNVDITRSKDFSVDDLSQSLYNLRESLKLVLSKVYNKAVQRQTVKMVLPDLSPEEVALVNKEIDSNDSMINLTQDLNTQDQRQRGLGQAEDIDKEEIGGPTNVVTREKEKRRRDRKEP